MRIVINGIGIAGTTLAYWLRKSGHEVMLVEQAPKFRRGGYIIDFWGVGYDIAERMGLIPRIRELGYQVEEVHYVDRDGAKAGGFATDVFTRMTNGRFTSVRRSDLAAVIYDALDEGVEVSFGDSVASLADAGDSVRVSFERAPTREFDLVIGADGLHSRVRELTFPEAASAEVSLDYHVAAFEISGYRPRDELIYMSHGEAGKQLSRFSMRDDKTLFLFIFCDEFLDGEPQQKEEQKAAIKKIFANVGWECPQILAAMEHADDVYFDRVSQIRMKKWTKDRVALVGDAAACVSLLAGEGTGLAIAEAYVLAHELKRYNEDFVMAFRSYEQRVMPFLARKQLSAAKFASSFAPKTEFGISFRNLVTRFLRVPFIANYFIGRDLRDDLKLPE